MMQSKNTKTQDILIEMRRKKVRSPPVERISSLDSGRPPTMIFTSRGKTVQRPRSVGLLSWESSKSGLNMRPSSEDLSRSKSSLKGQNEDFKVLNGNLKIHSAVNGNMDDPSEDSPRSRSSSAPRSPPLSTTILQSPSHNREEKSSSLSRQSSTSSTASKRQKRSQDFASSPPLIPPPKSFVKRKTSMTSSTSSIASQHALPPSPPPPPPPLDQNLAIDSTTQATDYPLPPYPEPEKDALSRSSSTNSRTQTQKLPAPPPPPSSASPPPPTPPRSPSPSPDSSPLFPPEVTPESTSSQNHTEAIPSSNLMSPNPVTVDGQHRKDSVSASEVMGYLDSALGEYSFSASSLSTSAEPFSPRPQFLSTSESQSGVSGHSAVEATTESTEITLKPEETVLTDTVSPKSEQPLTKTEEFYEKSELGTEGNGISLPMEFHSQGSDAYDSTNTSPRSAEGTAQGLSLDGMDARQSSEDSDQNAPERSPKPKSGRTKKRRTSVEVSKLQPDVKTVRQHIKPGTVDELATLFTQPPEDPVSPPKKMEEFEVNIQEKVEHLESMEKEAEEDFEPHRTTRRRSSHPLLSETFPEVNTAAAMEPVTRHRTLEYSQSVDTTLQVKPTLKTSSSDSNLSVSDLDPKLNPKFDYLTASKEIFRQISTSRENSLTRNRKDKNKDGTTESVAETSTTTTTISPGGEDEGIITANHMDVVEVSESGFTEDENTLSNVNISEEHYLNNRDNEEHGKHSPGAENAGKRNSDALLTSSVDQGGLQSILGTTVNIPQKDGPGDQDPQPLATEADLNREKEEATKHSAGVRGRGSNSGSVTIQPPSQVVSEAEMFSAYSHSDNKQSTTNSNKAPSVILGEKANENWSSQTEISVPQTDRMIGTRKSSMQANFGSDLETFDKLKQDEDLWDKESNPSTGSSGPANLNSWTTTDLTSKNDVTVIDTGSSDLAHTSEGNYGPFHKELDLTSLNRTGLNVSDVRTSREPESSIRFDQEETSSEDEKRNVSADEKRWSASADHQNIDKRENRESPTTFVSNVITEPAVTVPSQTKEVTEVGLFAHTGLARMGEGDVNSGRGDSTVAGVEHKSRNVDDIQRTSGRSYSRESSISIERASKEDFVPITGEREEDEGAGHTESETPKQSDDFLSILDDIKLDTDITSEFVGKSKLSRSHSPDPHPHGDLPSDHGERFMNVKEELTLSNAKRNSFARDYIIVDKQDTVRGSNAEESDKHFHLGQSSRSNSVKSNGSVKSAVDLNEAIRKQHQALSPQLTSPTVEEKSLSLGHADSNSVSSRGSRSSRSNGDAGRKSVGTKETAFNSDFFTTSDIIGGDNQEVTVPGQKYRIGSTSSDEANGKFVPESAGQESFSGDITTFDLTGKPSQERDARRESGHSVSSTEQTKESSTLHSASLLTPQAASAEQHSSQQKDEDESPLFSKDKFKALKSVFELEGQGEKKIQRTASFGKERKNFPPASSPPLAELSRAKYEERREKVSQVIGGFTGQDRSELTTTPDSQQVTYLPLHTDGQAQSEVKRDGEETDTSTDSSHGSDGSRVRNRKVRKKRRSKQSNSWFVLHTEANKGEPVSQKSSVRSSSSRGSGVRTTAKTVFVGVGNDSGSHRSSLREKRNSDDSADDDTIKHWETLGTLDEAEEGHGVNRKLTRVSSNDSSHFSADVLNKNNISRQSSSAHSDKNGTRRLSRASVDKGVGTEEIPPHPDHSNPSDSDSSTIKASSHKSSRNNSIKSASSRGSVRKHEESSFVAISDVRDHSPDSDHSSVKVKTETFTDYTSTPPKNDKTGASNYFEVSTQTSQAGLRKRSLRRKSSDKSAKQADYIEAFLGRHNTPKSGRSSLNWKPEETSQTKDTKVKFDRSNTSFENQKVSITGRDHDSSSNSSQSDDSSLNRKGRLYRLTSLTDSEAHSVKPFSTNSRKEEDMTAVVGEVSSFGIHKKVTTHEESFSVGSDNSSLPVSPRDSIAAQQEQNESDIYLIHDQQGDYYALQEVDGNDEHSRSAVQSNVTAHVMNSSRTDKNYGNFNGLSSPDNTDSKVDFYNRDMTRTDLYIDSSAVEEDKAREVISAFFDSQEPNRQPSARTVYSEDSFNQSRTLKQQYPHVYDSGAFREIDAASDYDSSTGRLFMVKSSGLDSRTNYQSSVQPGQLTVQQPGFSGSQADNTIVSGGFVNRGHYSDTGLQVRNSNVRVTDEVSTRADNSQTWTTPGFEPYTTGSGSGDRYTSTLHVTRNGPPLTQVYVSRPTTPVIDTGAIYSPGTPNQFLPEASIKDRPVATPLKTTPITITTTTEAVVGEKVDMHIDFSPPAITSETISSSSEDEGENKRYVVRSVPQKSSLKKTSKYDSSSFNDSGSDIVYTKKESVVADVSLGGKNREIVLQPYKGEAPPAKRTFSALDRRSPTTVDGRVYRVYQGPPSHLSRSLSPDSVRTSRREDRDYYTRSLYEQSSNVDADYPDGNLYRVRSVPNILADYNDHPRERPRNSSEKSYRVVQQRGRQHHSPERFFKNPKLSLRKDDYDTQGYSSEDNTKEKYRTVTKVYLDKPRSRSPSPTSRYKVSSVQSPADLTSKGKVQNDGHLYKVNRAKSSSKRYRTKSQRFSDTESDPGFRGQGQRYRVIGTSDSALNRHGVRAHSSPKLDRKHERSFEETTILRTESVHPSRLTDIPPATKTHKSVIQLELAGKNEKLSFDDSVDSRYRVGRVRSEDDDEDRDPRVMVKRVRSVDDLTRDNDSDNDNSSRYRVKQPKPADDVSYRVRSPTPSRTETTTTKITVNNQSPTDTKMWTTRSPRNADSSDDGDSDLDRTGVYDSAPRLVKTSKQRDGNKLYVVNSTVGDAKDVQVQNHPPGWYRSTIDINENHHDKANNNFVVFNKPNTSFSDSQTLNESRTDRQSYRTEKTVYFVREKSPPPQLNKISQRFHSSEFVSPDSGQGTEVASSDGENELHRQKYERVERIYEVRTEPQVPEHLQTQEDLTNDLRVLRGKILIKNKLEGSEHGDDDFDENANLFDTSFHLGKDNPLYSSDPDIMASLQREEELEMSKHVHQDITFDTVDKIAHRYKGEGNLMTPQPRRKQNLSQLLLSKLSTVDSKDIRQTIDVEHHNEEIYGDIDFIHADGQRSGSMHTSNFDSVNENVELTLTQGKAYVIIKVIAERIVPTDYEFNVWRKSQAIVTRQIEIDLLANEQRRRLYQHVMESAGPRGSIDDGRSRPGHTYADQLSPQERQLSSMETLKLFSQILDVTDGQGDRDHTDMRTRQEMGQLPPSASDLLY